MQEQDVAEQVEKARKSLDKQDAWAHKKMKKQSMENVIIEEHAYGKSVWEKLDFIYTKEMGNAKKPVLIYIHGGGWIAGSKNKRRVYLGAFAKAGFFVVNIDYTLAPEAVFPTAIGECVSATDYFMDHAKEYPVDLQRIALGGESAGVYYAAFLACIAKNKNLTEQLDIPRMRHLEFDVKANFFNCGAVDFALLEEGGFPQAKLMVDAYVGSREPETLKKISPMTYVEGNFPPTYLMYGQLDSLRNNTFYMQKIFEEKKIPYVLKKNTGIFYGQHTSSIILKDKKALDILDGVVEYLKKIL